MRSSLNGLLQPGISLNSSMADLSAITGVTDTELKEIELNAQSNAKAFGTDAATSADFKAKCSIGYFPPPIDKSMLGNCVYYF